MAQQQLDEAKEVFEVLNEQYITELPMLLDLRIREYPMLYRFAGGSEDDVAGSRAERGVTEAESGAGWHQRANRPTTAAGTNWADYSCTILFQRYHSVYPLRNNAPCRISTHRLFAAAPAHLPSPPPAYLDPSFEAMVRCQLRFAEEGYAKLSNVQRYFADNVRDEYANGQLDAQVEGVLNEMKDLTIYGA